MLPAKNSTENTPFQRSVTHFSLVHAELVESLYAKRNLPLPIHSFLFHPLSLQNTFKTKAHIQ